MHLPLEIIPCEEQEVVVLGVPNPLRFAGQHW